MGLGDVVDEFLDQDGFADASTAKETDFTATSIGGKEVDDLDAGFQDFCSGGLVDESGRVGVNGRELDTVDGTTLVDGLTNDVHDTTQGRFSNGNLNGSTSVDDLCTADETLGTVHSDRSHGVFTEMGSDFEDEATTVEILDLEGIENGGEGARIELDVDDGTDDCFYVTSGGV